MIENQPPPSNESAEQSVLGSIIIENSVFDEVLEILKPEDFYSESHSKIFDSMMKLNNNNVPIDVLTLYEHMESKGALLNEIGGSSYLTHLSNTVPSPYNVSFYAKMVKNCSILRKTISTATGIAYQGYKGVDNIDDYLDRAEQAILDIAQNKTSTDFYHTKALAGKTLEQIQYRIANKNEVTGISTGFKKLDYMTSGLQHSDLIIVAARTSMGKTSFCLNIISHAALEKRETVAMFSLEMTKEQLMLRMLSMKSKVSSSDIRSGYLKDDKEFEKIHKALNEFSKANIYIDDTASPTILEIKAKARRLKKKDERLSVIIVDYIQIMRGGAGSERTTREREIAEISGGLKALAKELNVVVIGISQLNRQPEIRKDKPQLSDIRESGAIEQDADVVMFIHREDAYRKKDEEKDGIAEIIIGKQRNGPTGTVKLAFLSQRGVPSFENIAEEEYTN